MMVNKIKNQGPWWLSLVLAAMGVFQQLALSTNSVRESTNDQAIHSLIEALMECQES